MREKIGHKIAIIGPSCSGKSTLAQQISEALDLPVHHLDQLVWMPGHDAVEEPKQQVDQALAVLLAKPRWVVEGVYARLLPPQVEAADCVIFLDLPRTLCLFRYLRRLWQGYSGKAQQLGLHDGDIGRFNWPMIRWILWDFPRKRPEIKAALSVAADKVLLLQSPSAVRGLLRAVR